MPSHEYPNVSIIGAGRVGSSLAVALHEAGYRVVSIISRTGPASIALARSVRCKKASTRIEDVDSSTELVLIAVPDEAISGVAKELARTKRLKFSNMFVAHTSGVHSSVLLEPLRRKGALVASIHPIQTFPEGRKRTKVQGIYFGIEGEMAAVGRAGKIVNNLGARSVVVPESLKALYHTACVFSSGYLVVMLNAIQQLAGKLGLQASWTEVFGPLMTSAMENTIKSSAGESLTGPVMRKDLKTIALHLESLARHAPEFVPLYLVAGIEAARVASEHHRMTEEEYRTVVDHFKKFLTSIPTIKKSKGKK